MSIFNYKNITYFLQVFLNLIPYWSNLHALKTEITVCIYQIRFSVTFRQDRVLVQSANDKATYRVHSTCKQHGKQLQFTHFYNSGQLSLASPKGR